LEAERLYQQATAADPQFPDAHIGLGRVRQRSGDLDGARKEAPTALAAAPSVGAWVLLAELDLASNRTDEAKTDAQNALRIEPANANAQAMLKQIVARTAQDK
jgi:tetratricopeptide (TPR) repeat protein